MLADKGYDSRDLVALIQAKGAEPVITPRSCQQPHPYDKARYRLRNRIERCFAKLKAVPPDRDAARPQAQPLPGFLYLASISLWLP